MKVILIPGLGYDHRIFSKLHLSTLKIEALNWIEPKKNENIHHYALRLYEQIDHSTEDIILIGQSLGGIMAQEIASSRPVKMIIIISSITSRKQLPFHFKIIKPLRIYKLFTKELSINSIKYWGKAHGFVNAEEIALFKSMLHKQTNTYLQWALRALSIWKEPEVLAPTKVLQIHGTNDQTFPIRLLKKVDKIVDGGSHIMVYKKPDQISEIINEFTKL